MLTEEQAIPIVSNCIRAVSHVSEVDFTGTLDDAEISDGKKVNRLINKIVTSKKIGVRSEHHEIDVGWFAGIDPDTIVDDVVVIVRDRSTAQLG